jgi:hypothetical protein
VVVVVVVVVVGRQKWGHRRTFSRMEEWEGLPLPLARS